MNILVIPTTDWTKHPVPNRLNFIFDIMAMDHNVHVAEFRLKKFSDQKARPTKCKLHNVTVINTEDPSSYYLFNGIFHLFKLRRLIREEKIDVIVCANILPVFLASLVKGRVPMVFDYLDHYEESAATYYPDSFFGNIVKRGVRWIIRYNLKKATSVITVTKEFKDYLKFIGVNKVDVIPNGADTSVFKKIPIETAKKELGLEGTILGYVGSLEYWIDLETVVESLPHLDAKLLVVGPSLFTDYGDRIKKLAEEKGTLDKIIFTGKIDYSELYKYICAMDIGLNPLKHVQKNEITVGGKLFNYLACGIPVLSSRMKAVVNLLGDDLYYYDDRDSLVSIVHDILSSEDNTTKYMEIAQKYDWKTIEKDYENVLKSV
jgi:glycosyltransferase involved in cell wall biosynthesis